MKPIPVGESAGFSQTYSTESTAIVNEWNDVIKEMGLSSSSHDSRVGVINTLASYFFSVSTFKNMHEKGLFAVAENLKIETSYGILMQLHYFVNNRRGRQPGSQSRDVVPPVRVPVLSASSSSPPAPPAITINEEENQRDPQQLHPIILPQPNSSEESTEQTEPNQSRLESPRSRIIDVYIDNDEDDDESESDEEEESEKKKKPIPSGRMIVKQFFEEKYEEDSTNNDNESDGYATKDVMKWLKRKFGVSLKPKYSSDILTRLCRDGFLKRIKFGRYVLNTDVPDVPVFTVDVIAEKTGKTVRAIVVTFFKEKYEKEYNEDWYEKGYALKDVQNWCEGEYGFRMKENYTILSKLSSGKILAKVCKGRFLLNTENDGTISKDVAKKLDEVLTYEPTSIGGSRKTKRKRTSSSNMDGEKTKKQKIQDPEVSQEFLKLE